MHLKTIAIAITAALTTFSAASASNAAAEPAPLVIERQGSFAVGGAVKVEPGSFDAHKPLLPAGQSYHGDHASVFYQVIVTHGSGFVQEWQQPARAIHPGDTVWIAPGVKHWHGASPHEGMTHVAIAESLNGETVTWMEKVDAAHYAAATRPHPR